MNIAYFDNKTLQWKTISFKTYFYILLGLFLIFSSFGFTTAIKFNNFVEKIPVIIKENYEQPTPDNIKKELEKLNIQNIDVVYSQICLETGNFTSNIWKSNNNLIGMKYARQRPTTAIGEERGHSVYNSWRECLIDYSIWQSIYCRNLTKNEYLQVLDKCYAEDENYINKLNKLLK